MGSLAARTRTAVDETPFVRVALRAGVLNFAAAARYLDVNGDEEAIATALRRYAAELPALEEGSRNLRVTMESGVRRDILQIDGEAPTGEETPLTAILATGDLDATYMATALARLANAEVPVVAAGLGDSQALFLVPRRRGAVALRHVEESADRPT